MRGRSSHVAVLAASLVLVAACGSRAEVDGSATTDPAPITTPATAPPATAPPATAPPAAGRAPARTPTSTRPPAPERTPSATAAPRAAVERAPAEVVVRYRLERRTTDAATADFARVVETVLTDRRGWSRAGFRLVRDDAAPYVVVLAEPAVVQRLCVPYDVYLRYSCQNGPVVALNAERWRTATRKWTGDLAAYKTMLVNHEVGHLLGQHHPPSPQCPRPGRPALVMSQQSTELDGCLPNPWPLPAEVTAAGRHVEPLAPPYEG